MRLALDTNRYTDLFRGDQAVVDIIEDADEVHLPFVVLGELRAGFLYGTKARANEATLEQFLRRPGISVLSADEQTSRHYASLHHHLRLRGTPIPTNDLWIAALCVQHALALYARDAHFDHLPQLMRV
jgi:tRNA(fMet)-specific endonuclease VapC